jgi:hypothetical protein
MSIRWTRTTGGRNGLDRSRSGRRRSIFLNLLLVEGSTHCHAEGDMQRFPSRTTTTMPCCQTRFQRTTLSEIRHKRPYSVSPLPLQPP